MLYGKCRGEKWIVSVQTIVKSLKTLSWSGLRLNDLETNEGLDFEFGQIDETLFSEVIVEKRAEDVYPIHSLQPKVQDSRNYLSC